MEIRVSVVMGVYNEPKHYIRKAIDSILVQTYKAFEFIIIFDNPDNKDLYAYLGDLKEKDDRIYLVRNDQNIGLTKSLNKAIGIARGEFIARMDADDISEPNRFEEQVKFLNNNPQIGVCGSQFNYIDENDKVIGCNLLPQEKKDYPYMIMPFFAHPAVMIRKSCLQNLKQPYDEHFRYAQDFDLWYRLDGICGFYNMPMKLFNYRKSANQIGVKRQKEQRFYSEKIQSKYLARINPQMTIEWSKLNFQKVFEIIETMKMEGLSKKALYIGSKQLCMRINDKKVHSIIQVLRFRKDLGLSFCDIYSIIRRIFISQ